MPQVQSDPTLNSGVITNGGQDLFSFPSVTQPSILELQTDTAQPLPPGTGTATNLLNPDLHIDDQLKAFPDTVFDTSPTSLLSHFMAALLGAGGVGQLRKRQLTARLQQAITSTHFYDLDSFYGALFGTQRGPSGALPVNGATGLPADPYTELATPDGWDEIEAIDARFRERIIALARALTLGATVPGLQAVAEAITGVPCQVYEMFRLPVSAGLPGSSTWADVEGSYATWSVLEGQAWSSIEGVVSFSGLIGAPTEVVIRPRKTYSSSEADLIAQGSDTYGILSVSEVLKPAASLLTVDSGQSGIVTEVPISSAWSDSNYCEIVHQVTPPSSTDPAYAPARNAYQAGGQVAGGTFLQPRTPLSRVEGGQYSYTGDVTAVTGQAVTGDDPNTAVVTDGQDFQTVVFRHLNVRDPVISTKVSYIPQKAIQDPVRAATARTAAAVSVISSPYSGPRVPVKRAT